MAEIIPKYKLNLLLDNEITGALDAARLSRRMTKTGYLRELLLSDLIKQGLMPRKAGKTVKVSV